MSRDARVVRLALSLMVIGVWLLWTLGAIIVFGTAACSYMLLAWPR